MKNYIIAASLLIIVAISSLIPLISTDFGFYYREGEKIALDGTPKHNSDDFSFKSQMHRFPTHMWLSELLYYLLYSHAGGARAIVLLSMFTACITFLFGFLVACSLHGSPNVYLLIALLILPFCRIGLISRPLIFGFALSMFFIYGLIQFASGKKLYLILLILAQILWVNLHSSFILGILLTLVLTVASVISTFTSRFILISAKASLRKFLLLSTAVVAASLINPWSYMILVSPFMHFFMPYFRHAVIEWMPVNESSGTSLYVCFTIYTVISLISFIPEKNRLKLTSLSIFLLLLIMALGSYRFIVQFMILSSPLIASNLTNTFVSRLLDSKKILIPVVSILSFICIGSFSYLPPYRSPGTHFDDSEMPRDAADILEKNKISGNIFNAYDFGGYLEFRLYPQNRVYIDGRFFVHGEAELKKYFSVLASASEFNEEVKKYDINIAVLSTLNPVYASLAAHLGSSGEWVLVHIDDVSSLLLRKNLETEPVIQKLKYKWLKPLTDIRYLSEIPEASRDEAYEEASKVASSHNGRTIGSFMLGYIHLQNALKGKPDTVRTKNELEKAAHFFAKAVSFHDDIGIIQYYFGKTLMLLGEKEKGEKALKKSSELIPQATN